MTILVVILAVNILTLQINFEIIAFVSVLISPPFHLLHLLRSFLGLFLIFGNSPFSKKALCLYRWIKCSITTRCFWLIQTDDKYLINCSVDSHVYVKKKVFLQYIHISFCIILTSCIEFKPFFSGFKSPLNFWLPLFLPILACLAKFSITSNTNSINQLN